MNKQSNIYTTIYIIVLVLIVGTVLAVTSLSLRDRQQDNVNADKMRQILASVKITANDGDIKQVFDRYIVEQMVINNAGEKIEGNAFDIDVATEIKLPDAERKLPVFVCKTDDGSTKYILPAYGAGLWGPIWGYIAVDSDGTTIYGAFFAHQGETPGLGAEIEKPKFSDQFKGKHLLIDGHFEAVSVIKAGMPAPEGADYVDGISGGTITSKGVGAMIENCLAPYASFLTGLAANK